MAYREVHMTEIKEILLRIASGYPIRSISRSLGIHRETIKNYVNSSLELGVDPKKDGVTDELVEKIKSRLAGKNKSVHIPRDNILLPHKDRIETYLEKGIKGSKIMALLARADKLFKHLRLSAIDGTYERTIGSYLRPDILIIDDFGIKEMTREEAGEFYEIILERYGKKSNIITSARSPEEWQALFPDPILGNSSLDRLDHSSYQILMEGESIRKQSRPK